MFNETQNLPHGEFDRRFELAGGNTNAATWVDWTYYQDDLPLPWLARPLAQALASTCSGVRCSRKRYINSRQVQKLSRPAARCSVMPAMAR